MDITKNVYSRKNVLDCIGAVKDFSFTVSRKNLHFAKFFEIKKLYTFLFEKTNCFLFEPESDPYLKDYSKMVSNLKAFTKKDLDKINKEIKLYLQHEVTALYNDIIKGNLHSIE